MQARAMNRVSVSTGVSNTPAIRLYESVGFIIVNQYLNTWSAEIGAAVLWDEYRKQPGLAS
jgi:ribosomal protein S18 acetylase RimI-like enzyme